MNIALIGKNWFFAVNMIVMVGLSLTLNIV